MSASLLSLTGRPTSAAALLHAVRGAQVNQLHLLLQQLPQSSGLLPERAAVLPVTVDAQDPERSHGDEQPGF